MRNNKFLLELRYKKLLTEYNALLLAMGTITLGLLIFSYNITSNLAVSIFVSILTFQFLSAKKIEIEDKLEEILKQI